MPAALRRRLLDPELDQLLLAESVQGAVEGPAGDAAPFGLKPLPDPDRSGVVPQRQNREQDQVLQLTDRFPSHSALLPSGSFPDHAPGWRAIPHRGRPRTVCRNCILSRLYTQGRGSQQRVPEGHLQ